jgi:hypothetical protein
VRGVRGPLAFGWEGRSGSARRTVIGRPGSGIPGDSISTPDPVTRLLRRTYWDTQLRLDYTRGRWQATGDFGYRLGRDSFGPRAFGGLHAAWGLRRGVALVAASRFEPSVPEQRLPARRIARVGVSLSRLPFGASSAKPSAATAREARLFRVRLLENGIHEIACRLPAAARVTATGDFTDWQPREMERSGDGWWRLLAPLSPGPHRMSLSVDGGTWTAPRGAPAASDGFGGEVGLFVVP